MKTCLQALLSGIVVLLSTHSWAFGTDNWHPTKEESGFYAKLYPEWRIDRFFGGAVAGTDVGHLGTMKNDTTVLTSDVATKNQVSDWEWSNSYVGLRHAWRTGAWKLGFNYDLYVDTVGDGDAWTNVMRNLDQRDAYVYAHHLEYGRLAWGQMDSLYKAWGDRYRMLGISAGNMISTARLLSQPAWRGGGDTTFHNRRANTLTYISPAYAGWQFGSAYSFSESETGPGGAGSRLWSSGVRWSNADWYFALAEEWHYDWLPMSGGTVDPASTSIRRDATTTHSKDRATRLSMGWKKAGFRIGADVAKMRYAEFGSGTEGGKFSSYQNHATQVTVQNRFANNFSLAFSYAIGGPGHCELTGEFACSTNQLGGYQLNWGGMLHLTKEVSLFMLVSEIKNRAASRYGQASQGSDLLSVATGVLFQFD